MGESKNKNAYGTDTIAFKLTTTSEKKVKQKHPWVFDESITKQSKKGKSGDIAIVFDEFTNRFLACGLYDPDSPIRLKLFQFRPRQVDQNLFKDLISQAFEKRKPLFNTNTNAYRLIFGENDFFPSLIADVYADTLVIKLYSKIWFPYFEDISNELMAISKCTNLVIRLSRSIQKDESQSKYKDGQILIGDQMLKEVVFVEHGVNFTTNVIKGHKTGFFLDHRHNRKMLGTLAKDKTVLDVFSYAGGFSIHALVGKAKEVTSVDISKQALKIAVKNASLNKFKGRHEVLPGDAFKILNDLVLEKRKFDIVVIDPPSFAKSTKEIDKARTSYFKLAQLGAQLVNKKGMLILASCSSRIEENLFFLINEQAMTAMGIEFTIERKTHHDIDHPIGFPEGAYLKCGYYKIKN